MNFWRNKTVRSLGNQCRPRLFRSTLVRSGMIESVYLIVAIVATIFVLSGFGCAVDDNQKGDFDYSSAQCVAARDGDLGADAFEKASATDKSFLLSCALSVVVGEADRTREERDRLLSKKHKLSNALLSQGIDVGYLDKDGNHLLNYVVLSYMPDQWKIDAVRKLINMGIDKNHSNKFGKNALDLAKFKGQHKIAEMLAGGP